MWQQNNGLRMILTRWESSMQPSKCKGTHRLSLILSNAKGIALQAPDKYKDQLVSLNDNMRSLKTETTFCRSYSNIGTDH